MEKKLKEVINNKMWAYFAPDGYIQMRSISHTKAISREMICQREYKGDNKVTYKDYEFAGYILKKVLVNIELNQN